MLVKICVSFERFGRCCGALIQKAPAFVRWLAIQLSTTAATRARRRGFFQRRGSQRLRSRRRLFLDRYKIAQRNWAQVRTNSPRPTRSMRSILFPVVRVQLLIESTGDVNALASACVWRAGVKIIILLAVRASTRQIDIAKMGPGFRRRSLYGAHVKHRAVVIAR